MRNKITRKDKKKLRAIILCHTGNADSRKSTYSKEQWFRVAFDKIKKEQDNVREIYPITMEFIDN